VVKLVMAVVLLIAAGGCGRAEEALPSARLVAGDQGCNGIDDDADGVLDEDYRALPTSCGIGGCASTGMTACIDGTVVDNCSAGMPFADTSCDGRDDDCDGASDEHYVAKITSGHCGVGACSAPFARSCEHGQVVERCTPRPPARQDSTCDGRDDNCDGTSDEACPSLAAGPARARF
jgi:hypothetical protein